MADSVKLLTKKGSFALSTGKIPGAYAVYADGRVTFTSDATDGPGACKAVIYTLETKSIKVGEGYFVTGSNSGRALMTAKKYTFPAALLELALKLKSEVPG